jgi:predicted transposase/invertase (TIGR01784 family)
MNMLIAEWNTMEYGEVQREEGRQEGRQAGREETARNALAKGLSIDTISAITGLTPDIIECIASTTGARTGGR